MSPHFRYRFLTSSHCAAARWGRVVLGSPSQHPSTSLPLDRKTTRESHRRPYRVDVALAHHPGHITRPAHPGPHPRRAVQNLDHPLLCSMDQAQPSSNLFLNILPLPLFNLTRRPPHHICLIRTITHGPPHRQRASTRPLLPSSSAISSFRPSHPSASTRTLLSLIHCITSRPAFRTCRMARLSTTPCRRYWMML